jgi:hypothetical protein
MQAAGGSKQKDAWRTAGRARRSKGCMALTKKKSKKGTKLRRAEGHAHRGHAAATAGTQRLVGFPFCYQAKCEREQSAACLAHR